MATTRRIVEAHLVQANKSKFTKASGQEFITPEQKQLLRQGTLHVVDVLTEMAQTACNTADTAAAREKEREVNRWGKEQFGADHPDEHDVFCFEELNVFAPRNESFNQNLYWLWPSGAVARYLEMGWGVDNMKEYQNFLYSLHLPVLK